MKIAIAVLGVMAAIWAAGALYAAHAAPLTYLGPAVIAAVLLILAAAKTFPSTSKAEGRRIGRLVAFATGFEVVAIIVGVQVLVRTGRADLVACFVAAVVGLHFLPLARWIPAPLYYLTCLALLATAGVGLMLAGDQRAIAVASAASAILFATAVGLVFSRPRLAAAAS
jgi:hypothetical protein